MPHPNDHLSDLEIDPAWVDWLTGTTWPGWDNPDEVRAWWLAGFVADEPGAGA